jgi:hypothetical protein
MPLIQDRDRVLPSSAALVERDVSRVISYREGTVE